MDSVTATSATTPRSTATASTRSNISSDYDTFLRMLTTQMQNQDPLNPIDSADYAVQLATFSGVEQQTRTNQLIEDLISTFDRMGLSDYAGWVGKEARSTAPVAFDGNPVTLTLIPEAMADRAVVVVRNASGVVVAREDVAAGGTSHTWQGMGMTGSAMATGQYSFDLESYRGETLISDRAVAAYARVTEVRAAPDGPRVVLSGGIEVPASQVTALRDAG